MLFMVGEWKKEENSAHDAHPFYARNPVSAPSKKPAAPAAESVSRTLSPHRGIAWCFAGGHQSGRVSIKPCAAVPSAGVACAIERTMLGRIAALAGDLPFDATCLTEDYELGLKIRSLGGRGALARIRSETGTAAVATREHFPGTLDSAIRQKSRWLLGIALQGWDRLGWPGGLMDRWMLIRDRKSVITALLTLLAYFALLLAVLFAAARAVYPPIQAFPALVPPDSNMAALLTLNSLVLGWRLFMRGLFTARVHGWREGLFSLPRALVGNYINFRAAARALRRYIAIALRRERNIWEKTDHRFPSKKLG